MSAAVVAREEEQLVDQFDYLHARRHLAMSIAGLCRSAVGLEHDAHARGFPSWPDHYSQIMLVALENYINEVDTRLLSLGGTASAAHTELPPTLTLADHLPVRIVDMECETDQVGCPAALQRIGIDCAATPEHCFRSLVELVECDTGYSILQEQNVLNTGSLERCLEECLCLQSQRRFTPCCGGACQELLFRCCSASALHTGLPLILSPEIGRAHD